jgi:hypothetical protein
MGETKTEKRPLKLTLPKMTTLALKGKQSVRASFKLPTACIHAINIVATQLGIKHRSLFDYLVQDKESLETIAGEIVRREHTQNEGIQKTYIISRESLLTLDTLAEKLKITRDALIELSVRRLLPIIEKEKENHRKRKHMIDLVQNHYKDSQKILDQIKESVGTDDPIYKAFQNTMATCEQVKTQIDDIIVKGKVVEDFNPAALKD